MRERGISLLEVLISAVLLALIMGGLANIFMTGKVYIMHNRYRMIAGELGKRFLNPIQKDVKANIEGTCLGSVGGNTDACPPFANLEGIIYMPKYSNFEKVKVGTNNLEIRKVVVSINWEEKSK